MELDVYQLAAFTAESFGGNPAAVIPLDSWIDDELMQKIAAEKKTPPPPTTPTGPRNQPRNIHQTKTSQ